jgi:sterol desaturase/sphingolipid hydroxylase (fatty acid hydroxylase superfamily)
MMIFAYLAFVLSYIYFTAKCFVVDVLKNKNKENAEEMLNKYFNSFPVVSYNIFIYSLPVFGFLGLIYTPSDFFILRSIATIFVSKTSGNIIFYLTHRYFHSNKGLYNYHKIHHEYTVPSGIRAAYSHPVDFIFGNLIPLGITPILLGADIYTLIFIIVYGNYSTIIQEHSNFEKTNKHHILHHKYLNCNYGAIWIDRKFQTLREIDENENENEN